MQDNILRSGDEDAFTPWAGTSQVLSLPQRAERHCGIHQALHLAVRFAIGGGDHEPRRPVPHRIPASTLGDEWHEPVRPRDFRVCAIFNHQQDDTMPLRNFMQQTAPGGTNRCALMRINQRAQERTTSGARFSAPGVPRSGAEGVQPAAPSRAHAGGLGGAAHRLPPAPAGAGAWGAKPRAAGAGTALATQIC